MKLVIGGCAQGKLDYVLGWYPPGSCAVWDGRLPEGGGEPGKITVIDHFHEWASERIRRGGRPEEEIREFVAANPECVIISNEVGSGIVPLDRAEREYRERTGRMLVRLAAQAEEVARVICGIGQRIK